MYQSDTNAKFSILFSQFYLPCFCFIWFHPVCNVDFAPESSVIITVTEDQSPHREDDFVKYFGLERHTDIQSEGIQL